MKHEYEIYILRVRKFWFDPTDSPLIRNIQLSQRQNVFPPRIKLSPVSPVVDLQPGEDGAAGDKGARQHAEPVQVGGEQLPDRVLQHNTQLDEYHQVWGREEFVRRSR